MNNIPDRWEDYQPVGSHVTGTRFIPFKVPLKTVICERLPPQERFSPASLMERVPNLKAIIDLTNTNRYYNPEEFTDRGILYCKINIRGGGQVPPPQKEQEFFDAVDHLVETLAYDSDALIGVHCTHGLNRTGYLICKYMVARMKIDPEDAIRTFEQARGYPMERANYINAIAATTADDFYTDSLQEQPRRKEPVENWRTENRNGISSGFQDSANYQTPPSRRYVDRTAASSKQQQKTSGYVYW